MEPRAREGAEIRSLCRARSPSYRSRESRLRPVKNSLRKILMGGGRLVKGVDLSELVETYLAQHDVQPVTIEKLRYLLKGDGGVRRSEDRRLDLAGDRRVANAVPQHQQDRVH